MRTGDSWVVVASSGPGGLTDDAGGDIAERAAVGTGDLEERVVGIVDGNPSLIGHDPFRLLDDGSGHEGLTRSGCDVGPDDLVWCEQDEGRHVGERLADDQQVCRLGYGLGEEEVDRPEHLTVP